MVDVDESFLNRLARGVAEFYGQKPFDSHDQFEAAHDEYQSLLDEAESRGLHDIGEGRDRLTFESRANDAVPRDCVVKVSKSDGTGQNREAIEIWSQMGEDARACVAPLVEWDEYRWIVQRQASHTAYGSSELRERLHEAGWTCSDIRTENVGEIDGDPVLMDLGVGLRER